VATYKLTPEADEDLTDIWVYGVRKHGEQQADAYLLGLFERFEKLAHQPYLYQAVDDVQQGYRRSVYGVNSIYYRVIEDGVEIIRILRHQDF